jgi:hypothetical protein
MPSMMTLWNDCFDHRSVEHNVPVDLAAGLVPAAGARVEQVPSGERQMQKGEEGMGGPGSRGHGASAGDNEFSSSAD